MKNFHNLSKKIKEISSVIYREKLVILIFLGILVISILFVFSWQFFWAHKEIERIAFEETKNITGDKEKALALVGWFHKYNISFGSTFFHIPEMVYFTKVGDCIDFSNIFVQMSNSIGIPARRVGTDGERHFWVEIFSENRWVNIDPFTNSEISYDNPKFYSDFWKDGDFNKRLSYVFWEDGTGIRHDLTEKYVETGRLVIKITDNSNPIETRIILKSHHLMEAKPDENREPSFSLSEKTDSSGIFDKNLGPNNYTIIAEQDIIPYFLLFRTQKDNVTVREKEQTIIELKVEKSLVFGDLAYCLVLILLLMICYKFKLFPFDKRK